MKMVSRWGLSARARLRPREDGEPPLIEMRCGGLQYLSVDEGRRLADELDDAIAAAEGGPDDE